MKQISLRILLPAILFVMGLISSCGPKKEEPLNLQLSETTITLSVGESKTLTVRGIGKDYKLSWSVNKPTIASVENGKVTAKAVGDAVVTVRVDCPCGKVQELNCQVIVNKGNLRYIPFEDANLKRLILERYDIDKNKDGELTPEEVEGVKALMFEFATKEEIAEKDKIKSLKGLEYFINLDSLGLKNQFVTNASPVFGLTHLVYLHLGNNDIAELNVSSMKQLKDLRAYGNINLKQLDLSHNVELEQLYLQNVSIPRLDLTPLKKLTKALLNKGQLKEIIFSDLPLLERIDMVENNLTTVKAKNLPVLKELHANSNEIDNVELKKLPKLERLNLYGNKLKQIDLSELHKIMFLFLFNNPLESLDLSNQQELFQLFISNSSLEQLDLSKNPAIASLEAINMSKLKTINLRNKGYNEEAEYFIVENNNALEKVMVDAGAEETHVRNLFKNNSKVTIEAE